MNDIEEIKALLKDHITQSNDFREQMKIDVSEIKVRAGYTRDEVSKHTSTIDKLKEQAKESSIAIKILSAIGLMGLIEFIKHYFFR
jgi:uncharacterized membrane protein YvbJ